MAAEAGSMPTRCASHVVPKELNLDAIHDTVHEMAKDEASATCRSFQGPYNRYFKK